jgi:hypothetical protein
MIADFLLVALLCNVAGNLTHSPAGRLAYLHKIDFELMPLLLNCQGWEEKIQPIFLG